MDDRGPGDDPALERRAIDQAGRLEQVRPTGLVAEVEGRGQERLVGDAIGRRERAHEPLQEVRSVVELMVPEDVHVVRDERLRERIEHGGIGGLRWQAAREDRSREERVARVDVDHRIAG